MLSGSSSILTTNVFSDRVRLRSSVCTLTAVHNQMTRDTEGDQVLIRIFSRLTAQFFMVNLKVCHRTAQLTSPAISPEYVLAERFVILLFEPDRRLFRRSLIH